MILLGHFARAAEVAGDVLLAPAEGLRFRRITTQTFGVVASHQDRTLFRIGRGVADLETACRTSFRRPMCLAEPRRLVARFAKQFGQRLARKLGVAQARAVAYDPDLGRIKPEHERVPAGHAHGRLANRLIEEDAVGGQPVERRRLHRRVHDAQVVATVLVVHQKDDVRTAAPRLVVRCRRRFRTVQDKASCQQCKGHDDRSGHFSQSTQSFAFLEPFYGVSKNLKNTKASCSPYFFQFAPVAKSLSPAIRLQFNSWIHAVIP